MPNDFITLHALKEELNVLLKDARINKINMPSDEEVHLALRAQGKNRTLVLSSQPPVPRVHLTVNKADYPKTPPTFCMLLRKHLIGGIIENIELLNNDRIVVINVASRNELHDLTRYKLIAELMGGASNLIFTDENYVVIDGARRLINEGNRCVMPHLPYIPPMQSKPSICDKEATKRLSGLPADALAKALGQEFVGLSKETVKEIAARAETAPIGEVLDEINDIFSRPTFAPCIAKDEDGIPKGYYVYPYSTVDGRYFPMPTLNDALDEFYRLTVEGCAKLKATKGIRQAAKKLRAKIEKKLAENATRVAQCVNKEEYLRLGEILKCNMHLINRAATSVEVYDFYNDKQIVVPLNPKLSPRQNAEACFKKYAKLKGAEAYAAKEKTELDELYEYVLSIEECIAICNSETEYNEIEAELNALSGKKPKAINRKKEKSSAPIQLEVAGYKVYIGKNNMQNDLVTFKLAGAKDIWLHVKGYHGSHGIIVTEGQEVSEKLIAKVASFVAYMSEARSADKVEVDYTKRANVKRKGKPGLVNYVNYNTVVVKPTSFS